MIRCCKCGQMVNQENIEYLNGYAFGPKCATDIWFIDDSPSPPSEVDKIIARRTMEILGKT